MFSHNIPQSFLTRPPRHQKKDYIFPLPVVYSKLCVELQGQECQCEVLVYFHKRMPAVHCPIAIQRVNIQVDMNCIKQPLINQS
jgi:hypothetical protein